MSSSKYHPTPNRFPGRLLTCKQLMSPLCSQNSHLAKDVMVHKCVNSSWKHKPQGVPASPPPLGVLQIGLPGSSGIRDQAPLKLPPSLLPARV